MAYEITDIGEHVEYHLVASAPDDDAAHSNLFQIVQKLELLAPRPLYREATWVFCDRCGCSVDTDLIHPMATTTPAMATSIALTAGLSGR
jgi:hypothetical protein